MIEVIFKPIAIFLSHCHSISYKNKTCEVVEVTVNYLEIEGDINVYSAKFFKRTVMKNIQ